VRRDALVKSYSIVLSENWEKLEEATRIREPIINAIDVWEIV
jgi:hypothetical protein